LKAESLREGTLLTDPKSSWLRKYRLHVIAAGVIAFVGGFVWLSDGYEYLDKACVFLVRSGTAIDAKSNQVMARPWFEAALILTALVIAGLVGLVLTGKDKPLEPAELAEKYKQLEADHGGALEMIGGMMAATSRIRNQLAPAGKSIKSFEFVKITYYIQKDFTAHVLREYGIRTNKEPMHFWTTENRATSHADPVDYLKDIAFEVNDEKGNKLPYLPIKNDAIAKEVVIYFLPRIEPGDPPRTVQIKFTWPRYLRQIEKLGYENFGFTLDSIDPIPNLEFSWFLEPGSGRNLVGEIASARITGDVFEPAANAPYMGKTWVGFSYKVKNGPAGTFKYELRARLETP
jgi:hypothetical protein